MSLSRLWQRQEKSQEARHLLAEIYGSFTEGLETADLVAAKALLDQLQQDHWQAKDAASRHLTFAICKT